MTDKAIDPSGQAMNRLLQAEQDAEQDIVDCASKAQEIVQQARKKARRIVERTDNRSVILQMRCKEGVGRRIRAMLLEENADSQDESIYRLEASARLNSAVKEMAEYLTAEAVTKRGGND